MCETQTLYNEDMYVEMSTVRDEQRTNDKQGKIMKLSLWTLETEFRNLEPINIIQK